MDADFTTMSDILFEYYESFTLTTISPPGGPTAGGTTVFIRGEGFAQFLRLACRFGQDVVPATVLTSNSLWCVAPVHSEGRTQVAIGFQGNDFGVSNLLYAFFPAPVISGSMPLSGPQAGGSLVQVTGVGFWNSPSLECRFGNVSAQGRFVSPSAVNCSTPPHAAQAVWLRVTNDGTEFSMSNVTFAFNADAVTSSLVPSHGPARRSINISVFGRSLVRQSKCVWHYASSDVAITTPTETFWISQSHVLCATPPFLLDRTVLLSLILFIVD